MLRRTDISQSSALPRSRVAALKLFCRRRTFLVLPQTSRCARCNATLPAPTAEQRHPSSIARGRQDNGAARAYIANSVTQQQSDPAAHAAALCRVLGLAQPRLMALVDRCPALFSFSPEALGTTLAALAELTGLQVFQVPQLVCADPDLLLHPDRLKSNMRGMAQALGVRPSEMVNMGAREPAVLALDGGAVEERLRALQRLMGLQGSRYDDLVAALLRNPGVLLVPEPATLEAQLQALEAALDAIMGQEEEEEGGDSDGGPLGRQDQHRSQQTFSEVLQASPTTAAAAVVAGGAATPQPSALRALVGSLVLSKPSLLSTPPQLLAGRVVHLAMKARVAPARVLVAATTGPDLLAASSCYLDRHCTAVAAALSHAGGCAGGESEAAAILVSAPRLLELNVGSLSAKWQLLAAVFRSCGEWERRLAAAAISERAELMAVPHSRLVRLRFLIDRGLQSDVDPMEALKVSDALFHIQYPDFRAWQQSG